MRKLIHVSWIALVLGACHQASTDSGSDAGDGSNAANGGSSDSSSGSGNASNNAGAGLGGASGDVGVAGNAGTIGSAGGDTNGGNGGADTNGGDGNVAGNGGNGNLGGNGGSGTTGGNGNLGGNSSLGGNGNAGGNGGSGTTGGNGNLGGNSNAGGNGGSGTTGGSGNAGGSNTAGDGNASGSGSVAGSGGDNGQAGDGDDNEPDASVGGSGQGPQDPPDADAPPPDAGPDLTGCAGGVMGHPTPGFDYPVHPGFTLCLAEEFDQPIDIHGGDPIWTYSDGALVEGAVRHVADGLSFADGNMIVTVRQQHTPVSWSWAADSFIPEKELTSGELRTKYNNFRYGRYEARLKAPNLIGNFISTMFSFRSPGYQQWREIDVEILGNLPNGLLTNLIVANNQPLWSAQIEEPAYNYPFGQAPSGLPIGYNNRTDYHTYAFEWTPNQVRWFVDDQMIRVKVGGVGEDHLPVPELPAKIMMNIWIFPNSDFGGNPALNVYPFTSEYDWFRYYKWNGETQYPCANAPGCLAADDLDFAKNNPEDGIPSYPLHN